MKSASAQLTAILEAIMNGGMSASAYSMADLWTITLINGAVLRYTSYDQNLTYGGHTFLAGDLQFERPGIKSTLGLEVATLDVKVSPCEGGACQINGIGALQAIAQGDLDWAVVRLERVFMSTPGDTAPGTVVLFVGLVTDVRGVGRSSAEFTVSSYLYLLDVQLPRNLIQPGCRHVLYDSGCTLSKSAFRVSGVIAAGSNVKVLQTNLTQTVQYFQLGVIAFTSGQNNGLSRAVIDYQANGQVTLAVNLPETPSVGDTFTIVPGCDKQQSTCQNKFNNLAHFGGFPYVPVPETVI